MDALIAPSQATDPILARMQRLGIREEDLDETFVRSGGHGGQNVNKVATCVMLVHRPTGITVKCQETRYQGRNRELARIQLLDRIESLRKSAAAAAQQERQRQLRQKRGRSASAKRRIRADKKHHSAKKSLRRTTGD